MLYATIASVYRIQTVGLNPPQLVLVGTVLELAVLTFEVPTGVLADTYGRRLSVIIGFFLIGAGFIFEGSVPVFAAVLAAQVIWGGGLHLYQRCVGGLDRGRLVGVVASALLATIALGAPLLLGGALTVALGATLIFLMREPNFRIPPPEGRSSSWSRMGATARVGVRLVRDRLVLLILLAVLSSLECLARASTACGRPTS